MNMKQHLMDDLKIAMRDKDTMRKDMIQILRAAILQVEKDSRTELDESGIAEIMAKGIRSVQKQSMNLPVKTDRT